MAERKALVRYLPKNYNYEQLNRPRKKDKDDRALCGMTRPRQSNVRMMLPMSIKCATCNDYNHAGSKFGMRMEIAFNQNYLGIQIHRFYFLCAWCFGEIVFKTDPKNYDYVVEAGGSRVYDPDRDAKQAETELKAIRKDQEQNNAMLSLQNRTYDSKREMQLMEHLESVRQYNRQHLALHPNQLFNNKNIIEHLNEHHKIQEQNDQFDKEYQQKIALLKPPPPPLQPVPDPHHDYPPPPYPKKSLFKRKITKPRIIPITTTTIKSQQQQSI